MKDADGSMYGNPWNRHKSVDTLRGYVRDAELFKDHAGTGLL
jgi:hypothetical protein